MHEGIPIIDLEPARHGTWQERLATARAIDVACRRQGFLIVSGHGVPARTIVAARTAATAFFSLAPETKRRYRVGAQGYRGYIAPDTEALAYSLGEASPPDLKEGFNMGPIDTPPEDLLHSPAARPFFVPNLWPDEVPDLRAALTAHYRAMTALATELMRLFAIGLGLDERWFDLLVDRHVSNMTALHYPPVTPGPEGQMRAGAHTDYGSLTILSREEKAGGLEVLLEDRWIPVEDPPGTLVVNLGDLMADWTGGAWRSTLHRVVNPPVGRQNSRLSIAFFHQPNHDAIISPLPGFSGPGDAAPITSGDHVLAKIRRHRTPELAHAGARAMPSGADLSD